MPPIVSNNHGQSLGDGGYSWSKNLITDQTWDSVFQLLSGSSWGWDVAEGLGNGAVAASVVAGMPGSTPGGSADAQMIVNLKAPNATLHCGVMARMTAFNTPDATYYWARLTGGNAQISKTVDGVTSTLGATVAFAHNANDLLRITFKLVGTTLVATFENLTTPNTEILSRSDSDITDAGLFGLRTGFTNSQIWWRSVEVTSL